MTLFQIIQILKEIALTQPNVKSATDGSIYDVMNTNPSVKYNVVHFSQTTHQSDEESDFYGLNIFYVSRLEDSLEDNRLQIQSIGKEVLDNIIRTFCENWNIDFPVITYTPFTQKFNDLCAGCYCNLRLEIPKEIICADDYVAEVVPGSGIKLQDIGITITQNGLIVVTPDAEYDGIGEIRIETNVPQSAAVLQDKEVEYTENGSYSIHPDAGYDGLSSVSVDVLVPDNYDEGYDDGKRDGEAEQKAKLTVTSFTENNTYTRENGWSAVTVNVPSDYQDGYDDGFDDGEAAQKAKLSSTSFTQNDTYTIENGWSAVTVDVPQYTGGTYEEGYEDGVADQKAKLTTLYVDVNGTYTREDGYSSITVDVAQTGYTQQDIDDAYNRGYQDGLEACQQLPITATSITINVANTITDSGTATTTVNPTSATVNLTYSSSDTSKATINGTTGKITVKANGSVTFCARDSISNLQSCKTVNVVKTETVTAFTYTADTSLIAYTGENRTITYSTSGFNSSSIGLITSMNVGYSKNGNTFTLSFPYNYYGEQKTYYADLTGYTSAGTKITTRINYTQEANPNTGHFIVVYNVTSTTVPTQLYYPSSPGCTHNCSENTLSAATIYTQTGGTIPLSNESYTFPVSGRIPVIYYLKGEVIGKGNFFGCSSIIELSGFSGVKRINESAFKNCTALTGITISGVEDFGPMDDGRYEVGVFQGCSSLHNINLDGTATRLAPSMFANCGSLGAVNIPSSISHIEDFCFENCSGTTSMTFNSSTPPSLGGEALGDTSYTFPIYVPSNAVSTYKSNRHWSGYADRIQAKP